MSTRTLAFPSPRTLAACCTVLLAAGSARAVDPEIGRYRGSLTVSVPAYLGEDVSATTRFKVAARMTGPGLAGGIRVLIQAPATPDLSQPARAFSVLANLQGQYFLTQERNDGGQASTPVTGTTTANRILVSGSGLQASGDGMYSTPFNVTLKLRRLGP